MTISQLLVEVIVVDGLLFSISDTECCGIYDFIFLVWAYFVYNFFNLSGLSKSQHATAPTNSQSNTESWKLY